MKAAKKKIDFSDNDIHDADDCDDDNNDNDRLHEYTRIYCIVIEALKYTVE